MSVLRAIGIFLIGAAVAAVTFVSGLVERAPALYADASQWISEHSPSGDADSYDPGSRLVVRVGQVRPDGVPANCFPRYRIRNSTGQAVLVVFGSDVPDGRGGRSRTVAIDSGRDFETELASAEDRYGSGADYAANAGKDRGGYETFSRDSNYDGHTSDLTDEFGGDSGSPSSSADGPTFDNRYAPDRDSDLYGEDRNSDWSRDANRQGYHDDDRGRRSDRGTQIADASGAVDLGQAAEQETAAAADVCPKAVDIDITTRNVR